MAIPGLVVPLLGENDLTIDIFTFLLLTQVYFDYAIYWLVIINDNVNHKAMKVSSNCQPDHQDQIEKNKYGKDEDGDPVVHDALRHGVVLLLQPIYLRLQVPREVFSSQGSRVQPGACNGHIREEVQKNKNKFKTFVIQRQPPLPLNGKCLHFWHSFPYLESRGAQNIQSQTCWKVPHSCYVPQQCSSDSLHPPCFPRKLVFGLWSSYVLLFLRISHTLLL